MGSHQAALEEDVTLFDGQTFSSLTGRTSGLPQGQLAFPSGQRHTFYCIFRLGFRATVAIVSDQAESAKKYATLVWEGDSRKILQSFPEAERQNFGFELWRLQQGEKPSDYRPLPSIGTGVFELRDQDERAWYRIVYLSRINDVIYILHCFQKKSRETPKREFETAKQRLKAVKARLAEEKRHEKRS